MAKSLRGGGVLPVFEEFKPKSEWKQDDLSHHLIINLPGFTKEQIKVSTQGQNIIRVGGQRLVAGNKWNRFIDDFQAPENTEMNTIRAKLQGGNLTITVPKKKSVVTESKTTDGAPKTTDTTPNKVPPTFDDKTLATPNTSKDDPTTKLSQADDVPQLLKEKPHSSLDKDNDVINKIEKSRKELPGDEEDETARRMKLKRNDGTAAALCEAKEKKDKEPKGKRVIDSDDYGAFTIGRYKKAVKGLTQLSEERQLLVNMGVAVLVIVSVSAYVTYKFASRKDKN